MAKDALRQDGLLTTPVAIILVGFLIAGVLYINENGLALPTTSDTPAQPAVRGAGTTNTPSPGTNPTQPPIEVPPIIASDHVRGNPNAPIALIEYSDYECPFCKRFHATAQQIVDKYSGQVMWVYRHFPLDQLHPKARQEAEAAECAAELGGEEVFWQMTDKIYEVTPSNNGLDLGKLPSLATEIGLDRQAFQDCLDSGRHTQRVEDDYQGGLQAGVSGTPGNILLNTQTGESQLIPGAFPYEQFQQILDQMLAN